jgi:hypothetical protein
MEMTGTVEFVNQPKDGKKKGSIKLSNGEYVGCWPNELDQFSKGQTVTMNVEPNEYNGKTYYNLAKDGVQAAQSVPTAPQPANTSDRDRNRSIVLQAILKACGGDVQKADIAFDWYLTHMLTLWEVKIKRLQGARTQDVVQAIEAIPEVESATVSDLDQHIPF